MAQMTCLVAMPFGVKRDALGGTIDFDLVYRVLMLPAIEQAGLVALRLDDILGTSALGASHLAKLMQSDVALFDLGSASPTVLYSLGVRHALRPRATLLVAAAGNQPLPGLSALRVLRYALNASGKPDQVESVQRQLQQLLRESLSAARVDSPVYQLVPELTAPVLRFAEDGGIAAAAAAEQERTLVDSLRQRVQRAGRLDLDELREAGADLLALPQPPSDVLGALLDAYRRQQGWQDIVDLVGRLPAAQAASPRVQEQLALAWSRLGQRAVAEGVLQALIARGEATNETHALLGRVYRELWMQARRDGHAAEAAQHLDQAVAAFLRAFEADWRDPFPGLSAVNLLAQVDVRDPRLVETLPAVRYALRRRATDSTQDVWDLASSLEMAVVADDEKGARDALRRLVGLPRSGWMIEIIVNNLTVLKEALLRQAALPAWLDEVIEAVASLARD